VLYWIHVGLAAPVPIPPPGFFSERIIKIMEFPRLRFLAIMNVPLFPFKQACQRNSFWFLPGALFWFFSPLHLTVCVVYLWGPYPLNCPPSDLSGVTQRRGTYMVHVQIGFRPQNFWFFGLLPRKKLFIDVSWNHSLSVSFRFLGLTYHFCKPRFFYYPAQGTIYTVFFSGLLKLFLFTGVHHLSQL